MDDKRQAGGAFSWVLLFYSGHPALAKRSRHPCRLPLRGLSTPAHRRTGAPVEQRAIVARTFQKSQSKAGAVRWTLPFLSNFFRSSFGCCLMIGNRPSSRYSDP
jgi:hypothetical protein